MKKIQIQLFEGHPIIHDGENKILIDTGAPSTIHISNTLEFCSENFPCSTNYMGLTIPKISELLGTEITSLLGVDVLSHFKILFDYKNQFVVFSKQELDFVGTQISISRFMGIPIIRMNVDNQELKFFLDTGAKLSYLSQSFTANFESLGTVEDFYPGVGKFETDFFEISTFLGDDEFLVKYGNLPALLQMTLMMGGTDGIIGFDFFNHFNVMLDLENNQLRYAK